VNSAHLLDRTPGLTYRMLDHWVRKGYLRHDQRRKDSSGVAREFSGDEVRVAQTMTRLVLAGLKPATAEKVARGGQEIAPGITVLVDTPTDGLAAV
jgi:DNA-binding transcriptional MerR regulator